MYLSKLEIENYRGIPHLSIDFSPAINIIIGENGCCKSAVIDAIRLLYNLGEPIRDISVTIEDFFESFKKDIDNYTINKAKHIKITYEFSGLSYAQKGAFYEYMVIDKDDEKKDIARIEILYENIGKEYPKFSYTTGGIEGQRADYNTFSLFQHYYLSALRDCTRDLMSTKNNLLGKVIKRHVDRKGTEEEIKGIIRETNNKLLQREEVKNTRDGINKNLEEIFKHIIENHIGVQIQQSKIEYIVNVIKPFLPHNFQTNSEHGFQLWQNSLGFNNLIYIATVLGDIKERILDDNIPHFALLIEEPEAHLHPQLQLNLYNFLKNANKSVNSQLFITTHSPTLTSKVPFENLILLDKIAYRIDNCFKNRVQENIIIDKKNKSIVTKEIFEEKKNMLERYIDVTKSQLFYAKACLFVEGISEELLLAAFCKVLNFNLEDYRIELINIGGTSFYPFLFLFNSSDYKKCISKKVTVLTDDDRYTESKNAEFSFDKLIEDNYRLLDELHSSIKIGKPCSRIDNLESIKNSQANILVKPSYKTLEYEICKENIIEDKEENKKRFLFKYIQTINNKDSARIIEYINSLPNPKMNKDEQEKVSILLWKSLPSKAEFAQNFANHLIDNLHEAKVNFSVPQYIIDGLNHLK